MSQDACLVRGTTPWPENEVACVILDPNRDPVLLTILLRDDPKPRTFELEMGSSSRARASTLRAVEFLRAQFDARRIVEPITAPAAPALPGAWLPEPRPRDWIAQLSWHIGWPGGASPGFGPGLSLVRRLNPTWSLGARWVGPTFGGRFVDGSSRADLSSMAATLLIGVTLWEGASASVRASGALGGMWSTLAGASQAEGLEVTTLGVASALGGAWLEAQWWWTSWLGADLGLGAMWALPRTEVSLGGARAGALGAPWVLSTLGLSTRW